MAAALVQLLFKKTGHKITSKCPMSSHFRTGLILADTNNYQRVPRRDKHHKTMPSNRNTKYESTTNVETGPKLNSLAESLASKGYLRPQKSYEPPADVISRINDIVKNAKVAEAATKGLILGDKFAILSTCFQEFGHGVPNSYLHEINSIADIIEFYQKGVNTTLPLDAMRTMELPANLHIQHEYVRFTEDSNAFFRGQTAFPRSSTLVTGLKYRKKYKGYTAKTSWP